MALIRNTTESVKNWRGGKGYKIKGDTAHGSTRGLSLLTVTNGLTYFFRGISFYTLQNAQLSLTHLSNLTDNR